jgi:hypothetical protein
MPTVGSGVYWPGLVILGRGMPHWLSGLVYALNPLWPNYSLQKFEGAPFRVRDGSDQVSRTAESSPVTRWGSVATTPSTQVPFDIRDR